MVRHVCRNRRSGQKKKAFVLAVSSQAEVSSPVGLWDGIATTSTETTRLQLDISRVDNDWQAQLNLLDIGVRGWPAESVIVNSNQLTVVLRADSGPQEMQLMFADGRLVGTWQARQTGWVEPSGISWLEQKPDANGEEIRWPSLPDSYYSDQAVFIKRAVHSR